MPSKIGSSEAPVPRYADVEAHFRVNKVLFDLKGEAQVVVIPIDDKNSTDTAEPVTCLEGVLAVAVMSCL